MKLRTLVWKTGVLTITQRPLSNYLLFHRLEGVKMTIASRVKEVTLGPVSDSAAEPSCDDRIDGDCSAHQRQPHVSDQDG